MFFPVLLSPPPPRHTYFLYPVSVDGRCFIPVSSRLFSPSRLGKRGQSGPLSPPRSTGGRCRPATGAPPVCLRIRTSMIRCPPTRQRVPTWGRTEDSLLLGAARAYNRCCCFFILRAIPISPPSTLFCPYRSTRPVDTINE